MSLSGDWSPTLPGRSITLKSVTCAAPIKHVRPNTARLISKLLSRQVKVGWNLAWMNLYFSIVTTPESCSDQTKLEKYKVKETM